MACLYKMKANCFSCVIKILIFVLFCLLEIILAKLYKNNSVCRNISIPIAFYSIIKAHRKKEKVTKYPDQLDGKRKGSDSARILLPPLQLYVASGRAMRSRIYLSCSIWSIDLFFLSFCWKNDNKAGQKKTKSSFVLVEGTHGAVYMPFRALWLFVLFLSVRLF